MKLIFSFGIFIGAMIICITTGHTMVIALFIGLISFTLVAIKNGYKFGQVVSMGLAGLKDAVVVVEVMLIIGFITAVWRSSGTISFFVYYGIKLITPNLFLIITFGLCCLLSYALGTSFGVAGTVGVIFMALARSGGVNEIITAAVVMSGIYFGDRGSPVSSSAILVSTITDTDLIGNVKMMVKTSIVPLGITVVFYGILSYLNPIQQVEESFVHSLRSQFVISWWCVIPAICMLVLPLMKVKVIYAMIASVVSGFFISILVQHMQIITLIKCLFMGYKSKGSLGPIINGGGMISMIEVVFIVAISSTYSGVFSGTKMLEGIQCKIKPMVSMFGRFGVMIIFSFISLSIFCNQTIASMMCSDILKNTYLETGGTKEELAIDMENSVILLAGVVPWALACSVPLKFMQVGYSAVPLSIFLYIVPICYAIQKKVANPFTKE